MATVEYKHHDPKDTYDFIVKFKREHDGNSPSYREMMKGTGITSSSHMQNMIHRLINRGWISWNSTRDITIIGGSWSPPAGPPVVAA